MRLVFRPRPNPPLTSTIPKLGSGAKAQLPSGRSPTTSSLKAPQPCPSCLAVLAVMPLDMTWG